MRGLAYRIANQVLIDHHRRTAVRARVAQHAPDLGAIASPAPGPEQVLAGRQALARLREALAELPVACRTAFLLQASTVSATRRLQVGSGSPSAW